MRFNRQWNESSEDGDVWEETAQLFRSSVSEESNASNFVEWGWSIDVEVLECCNPCLRPMNINVSEHIVFEDIPEDDNIYNENNFGEVNVESDIQPCVNLLHEESIFQGITNNVEVELDLEFDSKSKLVMTGNNEYPTFRKQSENHLKISSHAIRATAIPSAGVNCRPLLPVSRVQLLIKGAMRPPPLCSILR